MKIIAGMKKSLDGVDAPFRLLALRRRKQSITVVIAEESYRLVQRLLNGGGFLQIRKDAGVAQRDLGV